MATYAKYLNIIGNERIVSFLNDIGDSIPKTLEADLGLRVPSNPPQGNRKIVLMVKVEGEEGVSPEDQLLHLKVKVPDGIIKNGVQKFTAETPQLDYYPAVKVAPNNIEAEESFGGVAARWDITADDVDNQTIDVLIELTNFAGPSWPLFTLEIDWSHSFIN